jgi:hypothetical protein
MGAVESPAPHSADVAASLPPTGGTGPVRTCVGCRAAVPATALLRIVAVGTGASGEPVALAVDGRRRRPGRGAWLHGDPACFAAALRRRAFGRALRISTAIDPTAVGQHIEALDRTPSPKAE